jgi:glyoxylase-like metal-dependent hydrolase (beta-lactamase superfamily II)
MEIVPGMHRLEPDIGKKLVAHHLISGERSLLVDAGTPALAREALLPWISELLGDPARLDMILVTHADVDHYGGLSVLRAACPRALILAPVLDRRWIEQPAAIFAERYDAYHAEHGLTYEPSLTQTLHEWHGPPVPVDMGLIGGEELRCSQQCALRVLHVPGHTPGHLMLWEPRTRVAIIGDALNGATQLDRDGAWTAPPPYTDRNLYLTSVQTIEALDPALLLTGHYPVMHGQQITAFLHASRDFVLRTDAVLEHLLREAGEPVTLAECIERANPLLGPFGFPRDLAFALEAHLAWLERTNRVRRVQRNGLVAWELTEGKGNPA